MHINFALHGNMQRVFCVISIEGNTTQMYRRSSVDLFRRKCA